MLWSKRPYTFDRVVRIFFTAVVACIVLYFLYVLRRVLLPFCVACLIAYIIEPCVKWNQKILHIKSNTWAVLLTTFEAFLFLGILCLIFIPIVESECSQFAVLLDRYIRNDHPAFSRFPAEIHAFLHSHVDMDKVIAEVEKVNMTEFVEKLWRGITSGLDRILGVLGWLIVIVYVIFILLDFDKYKATVKKFIPDRYIPTVSLLGQDVSYTMKRYFRNQALISFIVGICYTIGFTIVGIPMSVVIGLACMILFMVPYMVYLTLIPVTVMCIFKSMETGTDFWLIWIECIAVYVAVEGFNDLILTPKIMGKAMGLNPAIILLSLSIWGTLLGLLGMLIALPATTIILKWGMLWLSHLKSTNSAPPVQQAPSSPSPSEPPASPSDS